MKPIKYTSDRKIAANQITNPFIFPLLPTTAFVTEIALALHNVKSSDNGKLISPGSAISVLDPTIRDPRTDIIRLVNEVSVVSSTLKRG